MGRLVTWQEPIVAIIVVLAVVSLYRHVRGMLGLDRPSSQASCHGCDSCSDGDESEPAAAIPSSGPAHRDP